MRLRYGTLIVWLLALALVAVGCGTQQTAQTGSGGEAADGKKTLVVGMDASFAPFEYVDANNQLTGFDVDLMKAIAKEAGFAVQFKNTSWEVLFLTLQNGETDVLISGITITDERKKTMDFSEPYFEAAQLIAVREDANVTQFADLKDKNLTVGVQTGSTADTIVSELLGKTSPNIKRYETVPNAMQALQIGDVDVVVADNAVVQNYLKNNPDAKLKTVEDEAFPKEYYGIAVKKGNKELLDKINKALKTLKENGTYDRLYEKYFGKAN
ncbi:basic amino acid ABC transporter substrate-binding protein [Calditerricola satsumensis]|uniref:Basic amino acid ABC transporter substrate-binding protein n=1 Tax=Calditerricola satsumensis TaxID=373054 RepID=A0A8J3B7W3_9BACI|nr:basic amino acid ABC transporter substrate-binding protein [Calditerricola satsumensis]GGJ94613.1 basic amino acid ABC transporter substrate-binding protein [Calditerricola satsumensis]